MLPAVLSGSLFRPAQVRSCSPRLERLPPGSAGDRAAVVAAIASPWSNGQTEGQITKLKLVKRQMCGPAKIDLIEARPLHTP